MQVREVMTSNPACCTPDTSLQEVAGLMAEHDCGCIPVVENLENKKPVGMITDRDITVRGVAAGKDVRSMTAADCMTGSVVSVKPGDSIDNCCSVMEEHQVRRVAVVDENGSCCGMVAQADVALQTSGQTADMVREVSKPTDTPSNIQGQ